MRKIAIMIIVVVTFGGVVSGVWLLQNQSPSSPEAIPSLINGSKRVINPDEHSYTDIDFAQKMIVHDQQGIQMADIATRNAANEEVRILAMRISEGLSRDTDQYASWLKEWDEKYFNLSDFPGMDGHDMYPTFSGMASYEQMSVLATASGNEAAKLFLQMAIVHHEGAAEMANSVAFESLQFGQMVDLKTSTLRRQAEEIQTMKQLQANIE